MKFHFQIISRTWLWLTIGFVAATVALRLFLSNLRFSVQFTGGIEVVVEKTVDATVIKPALDKALHDN